MGIESTRFQDPNLVSCEIVTRYTQTPLVGAYLSPLILDNLPDFEEALQQFKGLNPTILGVFNVDLEDAQSSRSQSMADLLTELSIIDLVHQFQQRRWFWYLNTWTQVRQGASLCLRCNYILGTDRRRFKLVRIRDIHNYMSDHFAIRARLLIRPNRCHTC